jgi:hypothetical protein
MCATGRRRVVVSESFLWPRRRSEQALLAVVQQANVCGVTRRVDQLVESPGCDLPSINPLIKTTCAWTPG